MMYSFEQLIEDVRHGREIEFRINGADYSITNTEMGWQVAENDRLLVSEISNDEALIEILKNEVVLKEKSIKDIFDHVLYDKESLFIL